MNYIIHLNGIFRQFTLDTRLNPTHISMYMALFQLWNLNRFPDTFYINRAEVMNMSKIGSKTTYHRCIRELNHFKYIIYFPSHNPFKGSQIKMFTFETSNKQPLDSHNPISGQAMVSTININKHTINNNKPLFKKEIFIFFRNKNWPEKEADKFFNYYESVGWKKGSALIENWQAAAESWMLRKNDFLAPSRDSKNNKNNDLPLDHNQDNLHINRNKNYNEPL